MVEKNRRRYRYEMKFSLSNYHANLLKQELKCVMRLDPHSVSQDLSYHIRSLYFDNPLSTAYLEKMDGVENRKKYRIRFYNNDLSLIKLECKHKHDMMTWKESCTITKEEAEALIKGELRIGHDNRELLVSFIEDQIIHHITPSVLVDYDRLAYVYDVSEVRITFDYHIRSGRYDTDLFDFDTNSLSVLDADKVVLEVKCNEFIPQHILNLLSRIPKVREAISKFALCRSIK